VTFRIRVQLPALAFTNLHILIELNSHWRTVMPLKDRKAYRAYHKKWMKNWRKNNPEKQKEFEKAERETLKGRVFEYLGGAKCVVCGCEDRRALEINHKNGGGRKDTVGVQRWTYLRNIIKNKRREELDIRCRVCNSAHYLEQKYGIRHKIRLL